MLRFAWPCWPQVAAQRAAHPSPPTRVPTEHPLHIPHPLPRTRGHSLGLGVVLSPDPLELIQVVGAKDGPVPCEVVKVVHDDGHKEVNDLGAEGTVTPHPTHSRAGQPTGSIQGAKRRQTHIRSGTGRCWGSLEPGDAVGDPTQRQDPHPMGLHGRMRPAHAALPSQEPAPVHGWAAAHGGYGEELKGMHGPTYQEGTEHVEADEVEDGEAAAAGVVGFSGVGWLRLGVALLVWETCQHDFLPGLASGTPGHSRGRGKTAVTFDIGWEGTGTLATCSCSTEVDYKPVRLTVGL